MTSMNSK